MAIAIIFMLALVAPAAARTEQRAPAARAHVNIVHLAPGDGLIAKFPLDLSALDLSPRKIPPPPAPDPSHAPSPVTLPAGTALIIRIVEAIDVASARTGATFKSLVDDPVMIRGAVVVPRSSLVVLKAMSVEQAGSTKCSDRIALRVQSIAFGGRLYDIITSAVESKGQIPAGTRLKFLLDAALTVKP
jgi:hypothetical protein